MNDDQIKRIYLDSTGFDLDDSDAALIDFARALLAHPDHSGDGGDKSACRELTDDDMDRVTTLIGQHESGELGFHGFCESIIKEFGIAVPVPQDGDERARWALGKVDKEKPC